MVKPGCPRRFRVLASRLHSAGAKRRAGARFARGANIKRSRAAARRSATLGWVARSEINDNAPCGNRAFREVVIEVRRSSCGIVGRCKLRGIIVPHFLIALAKSIVAAI